MNREAYFEYKLGKYAQSHSNPCQHIKENHYEFY